MLQLKDLFIIGIYIYIIKTNDDTKIITMATGILIAFLCVRMKSKRIEESVAGNGLLHRRVFLTQAGALFGAGTMGMLGSETTNAQNMGSTQ